MCGMQGGKWQRKAKAVDGTEINQGSPYRGAQTPHSSSEYIDGGEKGSRVTASQRPGQGPRRKATVLQCSVSALLSSFFCPRLASSSISERWQRTHRLRPRPRGRQRPHASTWPPQTQRRFCAVSWSHSSWYYYSLQLQVSQR